MQVKRFVAANMRLALNMVREEMGPDAVILSNKRVPDGVEILTAIDSADLVAPVTETPATSDNPFQQARDYNRQPAPAEQAKPSKLEIEVERMQNEAKQRAKEQFNQPTETPVATPTAINNPEKDQEITRMRHELKSMRDLLEQQLSSMAWGQFNQQNPHQASLWKRLKRMGIGAVVADELLAKQSKTAVENDSSDVWQSIMSELSGHLPVVDNDLISSGGVFAFVGPAGAGKTTTMGKLAARYVLENGAEDVALVTTDTMRIAAYEQLRTFGRILNVSVSIVDKNNSLERVLYSLRHKALVLVDTAGLNRQDERLKAQLSSLNEIGQRLKTVLVIPTTSQVEVIKAAYHIPNDIAVGSSTTLVHTAIELAKHMTTDDDAMADEMSTLSKSQTRAQPIMATC